MVKLMGHAATEAIDVIAGDQDDLENVIRLLDGSLNTSKSANMYIKSLSVYSIKGKFGWEVFLDSKRPFQQI